MKTINHEFRQKVQDEAVAELLKHRYSTGDIAMRLGKTVIGLRISQNFNRVLVSYPTISIQKSWLSDAETFGFKIDHITFTTHRSISKRNLKEYDCVIIDEIDQLSLANWQHIAAYYDDISIKGLTGTIPNKGFKVDLIRELCPVVYTIKTDETIGYTSKDYTINVHLIPPSTVRDIPLKNGGKWSELSKIIFFESIYEKEKSFNAMLSLMRVFINSRTKFNYAVRLIKSLGSGFLFLETANQCIESGFPAYHGKEPNSKQNLELFIKGEIPIMSTINQLTAGVTIKNLKTAVILHSYSSNNRSMQKIGRCLNLTEEGEKADLHLICLKGTRDEMWVTEFLSEVNPEKIKYITK